MNIPGFTAEASLYKMSDRYQTTIIFTHNQEAVFPAQVGGIPAPDGPDFPDIPSLPDLPVPGPKRICFYPCARRCFLAPPSIGGSWCFYPCNPICLWV
jgi:hypothetical protein